MAKTRISRLGMMEPYLFSSCAFENNNLDTIQHHPNWGNVPLSGLSVTGFTLCCVWKQPGVKAGLIEANRYS